jgi:hypothetical protein
MNKQKTITLWVIGLLCTLVWFWGAKADIPASAIGLAGWLVPGLLAYALKTSEVQLPGQTAQQEPITMPEQGPINAPVVPPEPAVGSPS